MRRNNFDSDRPLISNERKREMSTPSARLNNNLAQMVKTNIIHQHQIAPSEQIGYTAHEYKAANPQYITPIYNFSQYPMQYPYPPIALTQQYYNYLAIPMQQIQIQHVPQIIQNPAQIPASNSQPIYILYNPTAPDFEDDALSNNDDVPSEHLESFAHTKDVLVQNIPKYSKEREEEKLLKEVIQVKSPQEVVPIKPPQETVSIKEPLKSKEDEAPSFFDTFPSKIGVNPNDERPIRPRKSPQFVNELDVIPEKIKSTRNDQKHFLKKKKVYDPKESIMKEKETKTKGKHSMIIDTKPASIAQQSKHPIVNEAKEPKKKPILSQIGKSKSDLSKQNETGISKFTEMDSQQRLHKISQLLRMNKS